MSEFRKYPTPNWEYFIRQTKGSTLLLLCCVVLLASPPTAHQTPHHSYQHQQHARFFRFQLFTISKLFKDNSWHIRRIHALFTYKIARNTQLFNVLWRYFHLRAADGNEKCALMKIVGVVFSCFFVFVATLKMCCVLNKCQLAKAHRTFIQYLMKITLITLVIWN